jgi:hypothetical protein
MAQTMPFRIGADASCTDGACGQVSRIIVNPICIQRVWQRRQPGRGHPARPGPSPLSSAG